MIIGAARIELFPLGTGSLKAKRSIVRKLVARANGRYEATIGEVDAHDDLNRAVLGVTTLSTEAAHADATLAEVARFIEEQRLAPVYAVETTRFAFRAGSAAGSGRAPGTEAGPDVLSWAEFEDDDDDG